MARQESHEEKWMDACIMLYALEWTRTQIRSIAHAQRLRGNTASTGKNKCMNRCMLRALVLADTEKGEGAFLNKWTRHDKSLTPPPTKITLSL